MKKLYKVELNINGPIDKSNNLVVLSNRDDYVTDLSSIFSTDNDPLKYKNLTIGNITEVELKDGNSIEEDTKNPGWYIVKEPNRLRYKKPLAFWNIWNIKDLAEKGVSDPYGAGYIMGVNTNKACTFGISTVIFPGMYDRKVYDLALHTVLNNNNYTMIQHIIHDYQKYHFNVCNNQYLIETLAKDADSITLGVIKGITDAGIELRDSDVAVLLNILVGVIDSARYDDKYVKNFIDIISEYRFNDTAALLPLLFDSVKSHPCNQQAENVIRWIITMLSFTKVDLTLAKYIASYHHVNIYNNLFDTFDIEDIDIEDVTSIVNRNDRYHDYFDDTKYIRIIKWRD